MARKFSSPVIFTVGIVAILFGCGKAASIYKETRGGIRIIVFTRDNPKSLLSVHADKTKILQIGSWEFENLRGFGKSFEEIPELQSLVFVTEENGAVFIHAFDLTRNLDRKASLGDASGFGYWVGSSNQQHEAISMLTSNKLLLTIMGPSYPERKPTRWEFTFDLDQKNVMLSAKKDL